MFKRIEKDFGRVVMDGDRIIDYEGGNTGEGSVYKDMDAFYNGEGICYISEYGLEDLHENLTDLEARYENSEMTDDEYRRERQEILDNCGETRQTIIDQVMDAFGDDYLLTPKQAAYFAEDVLELAEWAYICTYLAENYDIDDCIEFDHIKGTGVYSELQYEAVMAGKYPKEYKEENGFV